GRGPAGAVDMDDNGAHIARLREPRERLDPVAVVADQPGDVDAGDLPAADLGEAVTPERPGHRDDRHDRHRDRGDAPERELAPHAAAIDDEIGIERHGGPQLPGSDSRGKCRAKKSGSMARSNAPQLWQMQAKWTGLNAIMPGRGPGMMQDSAALR